MLVSNFQMKRSANPIPTIAAMITMMMMIGLMYSLQTVVINTNNFVKKIFNNKLRKKKTHLTIKVDGRDKSVE